MGEVASLMGVTTQVVHAKWTGLRNQYSREKRKIADNGTDPIYTSTWYGFYELESLMSCNTLQRSISNRSHSEEGDSFTTPTPPSPPTPSPSCASTPHVYVKKPRQNSFFSETVQSQRANTAANTDDELTSYGLYIAAHLRKFQPHLQCQARFQINKILYELDMKSLGLEIEYNGK